jgi:hypothetical protein
MPLPFSPDHGNLPYIEHDGQRRILARLPPARSRSRFMAPRWASAMPVIPQSQWTEQSLEYLQPPILDQDGHGSCVGHGAATGFMIAHLIQSQALVKFASCFIYGLINGGRDNGAVVRDAMDVLMGTGCCTEDDVPEGMIYSRQFPASAKANAAQWKALKCLSCPTVAEIGSALELNWPVVIGIQVGNNFGHLDNEGVSPLPGGGGGGHCMCLLGKAKSAKYGWKFRDQNSWGASWGDAGRTYLQAGHFDRDGDNFAIQAAKWNPADPFAPPEPQAFNSSDLPDARA